MPTKLFLMHFLIFENFLKIFGNFWEISEVLKNNFLNNFASFENFLTTRQPIRTQEI